MCAECACVSVSQLEAVQRERQGKRASASKVPAPAQAQAQGYALSAHRPTRMHCHVLHLPPFRCPSSRHASPLDVGTLSPDSDHASDLLVASIAPVRYRGLCVAQEDGFLYNRHLRGLLAVGSRGSDRAEKRKERLKGGSESGVERYALLRAW